jgi:hypothetical protein
MEAERDDVVDHHERSLPRDGHVAEELAGHRVGNDGALVADDRVVDPGLLDVRADRAEHPSGDDDHAHAGRAHGGDRSLRPRPQDSVLGDQGAVEVDRERGERAGKAGGELYGSVPPVDFTT